MSDAPVRRLHAATRRMPVLYGMLAPLGAHYRPAGLSGDMVTPMHRDVHVIGGKDYTVDLTANEEYVVRTGGDAFYFDLGRGWLRTETNRKGFVPLAWEARMVLDAALDEPMVDLSSST